MDSDQEEAAREHEEWRARVRREVLAMLEAQARAVCELLDQGPPAKRPRREHAGPKPRTEHDDFDYVFDWPVPGRAFSRDVRPEALARFTSSGVAPRHGQMLRMRKPPFEVLAVVGVGRVLSDDRPTLVFAEDHNRDVGSYYVEGLFDVWKAFAPTDLPDAEIRPHFLEHPD